MRTFCVLILLSSLVGCDQLAKSGKAKRDVGAPGGIARPADVDAVAGAGNAQPKQPQPAPQAAQPAPAEKPNDGKGIIGKMTNEIVDMKTAMAKNPNLQRVGSPFKITAKDYVSAVAQAYIVKRSQASLFGLQRAIQLYQAEHERLPKYNELMKMIRENNVEFAMLPHKQKYAYDDETGNIEILQDTTK